MTATNHALTGAVIALVVKQPALAIPLALASHFVCDMIPHFDAGSKPAWLAKTVIAVDSIMSGSLVILLSIFLHASVSHWPIFACMFIAMSPDLVWGWRYYKFRDLNKITTEPMSLFSRYHQKIQWSETHSGAFVEAGWLALMVWLIFQLAD